jgi:Ran GTPase-activating protein (RanGAP) involved in mRNA processing and transport
LGRNAGVNIARALQHNHHFGQLILARNTLRDEGIIAMIPFLMKNRTIVHLDISSNDIGSTGCAALFKSMVMHRSITSINISSPDGLNRNRASVKGSKPLKQLLCHNKILSILNIAGNSLGLEGFNYLLKGLRNN